VDSLGGGVSAVKSVRACQVMTGYVAAGILSIMTDSDSHTGRITEIRDQVRDPERVSLFIDGKFRLGLPRIAVAERHLRVGQILTEDDLTELEGVDEISRATHQAVRLLSYRPRSKNEISTRLRRNGFGDEAISAAIGRMEELGYINDEDFATFWVENRQQHRPRGRRLIAQELRAKGVSQEVAEQAVEEAGIDEFSQALELAQKRAERMRGLEREVWRRRMAGFLQRRGYNWDVTRRVLEEIEQNQDPG
jgi:regulatory protein